MDYNELLPGMAFTRAAIAKAVTKWDHRAAAAYAEGRWGRNSSPAMILREAVGGFEVGTDNTLYSEMGRASTAFVELARPMTIIGKLQNFRRVPARTPIVKQTSQATAYWVGEGAARPLTKSAFQYDTVTPLTVAALTVMSNELLESTDQASEMLIRNDLLKALVELMDTSFIDPTNAGTAGKTPASITATATTLASNGSLTNDIEAAIDAFSGDLSAAAWVMPPRLAVQIGLRAGGQGLAVDLGAKGGVMCGLPVITSESANYSDSDGWQFVLVDASGIVLLEEELRVRASNHASVEMDTAPTGDTLTPTGGSTAMVNLFQTESAGILLEQGMNWEVVRDGAVIVTSGVNYADAV